MSGNSSPPANPLARKLAIDLSIMTVLGVVMALIGPFGSFNDPLVTRLIVWLALAYAGYCIYSPVGWLVERLHRSLALPKLGLWIAGVVLATVPMTLIVWSVGQVAYPTYRLPSGQVFLIQYSYVFVVGAAATALFNLLERPAEPACIRPRTETSGKQGQAKSRFLERLPPELGAELLALEMEDHYVRAHTALGSDLVLMRLRDAMAEIDGIEGMQVHRSWWVARLAVRDVKREGRNIRLVLENGLEAPVSRTNVQPLKDAGWI